jgi:anti-anti-sigma factor
MKVKIDTKEKFHVITIEEPVFTANMTEEWRQSLLSYLSLGTKNVILDFQQVQEIDAPGAGMLVDVQQQFNDHHSSFVCCGMKPQLESLLMQMEIRKSLNLTRTQSEAWDMVQMEEIERELGF